MYLADQQGDRGTDSTLSIAEAIRGAMATSSKKVKSPAIGGPDDPQVPEPPRPLRESSSSRQVRMGSAPQPLFLSTQQPEVRGFNPSPASQTSPFIDSIHASSEHAFAGRAPHRPFKPPLGVLQNTPPLPRDERYSSLRTQEDDRRPSLPLPPPIPPDDFGPERHRSLKSTKSHEGMRNLNRRVSDKQLGRRKSGDAASEVSSARTKTTADEVQESRRSAATNRSSAANTNSVYTARSSFTGNSSHSDFVKITADDLYDTENSDLDLSVEDAIGMYEHGFPGPVDPRYIPTSSVDDQKAIPKDSSDDPIPRPVSQPKHPQKSARPNAAHRRSSSAGALLRAAKDGPPGPKRSAELSPRPLTSSARIVSDGNSRPQPTSTLPAQPNAAVPRDRYGFKKASHYITAAQYDAWDGSYRAYIERRSKKWHVLMRAYGLSSDPPIRFPPKSDKIKRYVRKGIPPELRGAAWFWYAGGPGKLAKQPGLYQQLLAKVGAGQLAENDREHIERDLNRTFPDNIRFKPNPPATPPAPTSGSGAQSHHRRRTASEPETPMLKALRRVLQAFAVHNPTIGYCQSLNFIAGLLLLFLDEDEEKAFVLLNIVTTEHLPGTHGVALEGANIDIAVLMSCVREMLPNIWKKLDDKGGGISGGDGGDVGGGTLRLPTVSLATTAWFMSLFVGTLPIESVLRVWDCLFFEGSKTLFRIALSIFKFGEVQILDVSDPMEIFQVVQTIPRSMLDVNALMEVCFRRRGGFGSVSQGLIETRREENRKLVQEGLTVALTDENAFKKLKGRLRSRTVKG